MSQHVLEVKSRENTGKEAAKRLRREGYLPAVAYGHKEEPVKLTVHAKTLRDIIAHEGSHGLFNLKQEGAADLPVIIKSLQKHPVTHAVTSIDFLRVSPDEKVTSVVPIHLTGESDGVRVEGGVLVQALHEIEVQAVPADIPESISVDISSLIFNGPPLHVSEITLPKGVAAVTDGATPVAVINPPTVAAEPEEAADANAVPATKVSGEAISEQTAEENNPG